MKLYQRDEIQAVVGIDDEALRQVEAGFIALGRGEAVQPAILSMVMEEFNSEVDVKTAHIKGWERYAIKVSSGAFDNPKHGLPSLNGLMMLFSARTGQVEAVLFDEGYLTMVRTAMAGAIAAKYLSREDSRRVAVLGAGEQAQRQVEALRLVRNIDIVDVWARRSEGAEDYADRMRSRGFTVSMHDSVHSACDQADIIITATSAREPLLFAHDLPDGVHVTAMGSDSPDKRELDESVLIHAGAFVCDCRAQSEHNGELKVFTQEKREPPFVVLELGRVIDRGERLRTSEADITVCDLTGTGVQDTAIASFALSRLAGR
ncbi:MAG: cyclodeaminase [Halomonas sp.]|nr:cyclodeaminase [Halomonas sp.]MCC5883182.1 cyclodeaminase [Halomonas sp.]